MLQEGEKKGKKKVERKAPMMKMPTWALYISPLHQPAAQLLIQANLSSERLKRKCCSVILEKHTASPLTACCPDSVLLDNKLLQAGPCKKKRRPGQPWINDISTWLRETLPSQRNQSPLLQQRHINLSGNSFPLISTLHPPLHLPLSLSKADVKAVKCKVFSYKLTSVEVQA